MTSVVGAAAAASGGGSAVRRLPACFCPAFLAVKPRTPAATRTPSRAFYSHSYSAAALAPRQFTAFSSPTRFTRSPTVRFSSISAVKGSSTGTTLTRTTADDAPAASADVVVHYEDPLDAAFVTHDQKTKAAQHKMSILHTNMGGNRTFHTPDHGAALLDGLDVYSVPALGDHHPLAVYGLDSLDTATNTNSSSKDARHPILLLHGRTWSSIPVYHLLGGDLSRNPLVKEDDTHESRSVFEALVDMGLQPYAMDWRGFGGTPPDETGYVEPHRCVQDVETVLLWIAQRHGKELKVNPATTGGGCTVTAADGDNEESSMEMPALLGWSQGALVAQLVAQSHPTLLSKLVLYGSIYDPLVRYPREPLYSINEPNASQIPNSFNDAIEDFTVQGTIPPEPARLFAEAALVSDPVKAVWKHLYQFNNCDPARVHVPTLVVAGDQDPYAPLHVQQELFCNLGRGSDRTWSILADADHAAHLLNEARHRFINITTSFVSNGKRGDHHE